MKRLLLTLALVLALALPAGAAIVYVDLVSGDDDTGDGSYSSPYLTVAKADDYVSTGGDEIRIALTTMNTLSGTLTFTEGSADVTTSVDLTGTISAGDVISKNEVGEAWWLVSSITSDTITLGQLFYGSGGSETTTGYHMTPIDLGGSYISFYENGTSVGSLILMTGGWDLTTQARTGLTALYSSSSSSAITIHSSGSYNEVAYFVVTYGYDFGTAFSLYGAYSYFHHLYVAGDADYGGIQTSGSDYGIFEEIYTTGPGDATNMYGGSFCEYSDIYMYSPSTVGLIFAAGEIWSLVKDSVCAGQTGSSLSQACIVTGAPAVVNNSTFRNSAVGLQTYGGVSVLYSNGNTFNTIADEGIYAYECEPVYSGNDTFTNVRVNLQSTCSDQFNLFYDTAAGDAGAISLYSTAVKNTTDARSGSCLEFTISNTSRNYAPADKTIGSVIVTSAATDLTLSIYIKEDGSLGTNGRAYIVALINGKRVGYEEIDPTTSYVEHTIVVDSADLTVGKNLRLVASVFGTATGAFFFDDFSYSQ